MKNPFMKGHSRDNDDLHGEVPNPNQRTPENGATPEKGGLIPFAPNGWDSDPRNWGGHGYQSKDGWYIPGTSGADIDVDRYRRMGGKGEAAPELDRRHLQSRFQQMTALGELQRAAKGGAPSRAAALGQLANENALRAGSAGVAGARGPGQSVVAMRRAQGDVASRMGQANQGQMDMRAAEIARDQQAYAAGAHGVRGQDLGVATTNAQLEAQQRALNEQKQQAYERMAWDTRNTQMNAELERKGQDDRNAMAKRQQREAEKQADFDKIKDVASVGAGTVMPLLDPTGSDERMKTNVRPIGGLARLFPRR